MKTIKYLLIILLPMLALCGCENDDAGNPSFSDNEIYIYTDWAQEVTGTIGTAFTINITNVSPANDTYTYNWTIDGVTVSTERNLKYIPTVAVASAVLKVTVTRSTGASTSRVATLIVQ